MRNRILAAIALATVAGAASAGTVYPVQDPNYTFEIYSTASEGIVGQTFTSGGQLIRSNGGGGVYVHSLLADTTIHGSNTIHSSVFQSISGLGSGYGLTTGLDGTIYANTSAGVQVINLGTSTATTLANTSGHGGSYGIKTMADGRIAHNDGSSRIWIYNPANGTDTLIYSSPVFIDDIATDTLGNIFLAGQNSNRTIIIDSTGNVLNSINTSIVGINDGMAFGNGEIYKNNTNGTISRLDFAAGGYTTLLSETVIASGGGYGDLASVGPDGAFYVTNQSVRYFDGTSTAGSGYALVRISCNAGPCFAGGGVPDPTPDPNPTTGVPEPATLSLLGLGMAGLFVTRRRKTVR